jgi:hypothetical protein
MTLSLDPILNHRNLTQNFIANSLTFILILLSQQRQYMSDVFSPSHISSSNFSFFLLCDRLVPWPILGLCTCTEWWMMTSVMSVGWMAGRKPAPVTLYPPQIPHDLTWSRTRAAAVGSRWLNSWATAWLYFDYNSVFISFPSWMPLKLNTSVGTVRVK